MVKNNNKPVIILIESQLAENVGTATRAMMNCDLYELRLVNPREDWLSEKAISASSGADEILRNAKHFTSVDEAVADLQFIAATTARKRDMTKTVSTAAQISSKIHKLASDDIKVGIIFGPERTGLHNDHIAMADEIIEIPLNPRHCSLNLAQAVLLVGYEWYKESIDTPKSQLTMTKTNIATKESVNHFYECLESKLDNTGFLDIGDKRPRMVRNIRNIFNRVSLTEQEVKNLYGVINSLSKPDS